MQWSPADGTRQTLIQAIIAKGTGRVKGQGRDWLPFSSRSNFRGIAELSYLDNLIQEGNYNKTGRSIGRCDRLFLLVALGVVMREVYKVKRRGNVLHLFTRRAKPPHMRPSWSYLPYYRADGRRPICPEQIPLQLGLQAETRELRTSSESAQTA